MISKLCEVKVTNHPIYINIGFFGYQIPVKNEHRRVIRELITTGKWKIVVTDGKKVELYLECLDGLYLRPVWVHEDKLDVIKYPEPVIPQITEYINECARCE